MLTLADTPVNAETARNNGGTGIGLATTKGLVEENGGTICLVENNDSTTEFQIQVPLSQV